MGQYEWLCMSLSGFLNPCVTTNSNWKTGKKQCQAELFQMCLIFTRTWTSNWPIEAFENSLSQGESGGMWENHCNQPQKMQPNPHPDVKKSHLGWMMRTTEIQTLRNYILWKHEKGITICCMCKWMSDSFYLITYGLVGLNPIYIVGCDEFCIFPGLQTGI